MPVKYKLCPSCGQPMLRKGQVRENPTDYRHASGCPKDKTKANRAPSTPDPPCPKCGGRNRRDVLQACPDCYTP